MAISDTARKNHDELLPINFAGTVQLRRICGTCVNGRCTRWQLDVTGRITSSVSAVIAACWTE